MKFKKYRLLSYKIEGGFFALNATGHNYILTVEQWTFWGLIKRIVKVKEELPFGMSTSFWDKQLNVWQYK